MTRRRESHATEGLFARLDRRNQRKLEEANERAKDAALDFRRVVTADGAEVTVQVLPTGYPVNSWGEGDFLFLPFWWLRHRLLHNGEYSVAVHQQRKFWGGDRVVNRQSGMSLEAARPRRQRRRSNCGRAPHGGADPAGSRRRTRATDLRSGPSATAPRGAARCRSTGGMGQRQAVKH